MKDTAKYKALLEQEYKRIVDELKTVGRVNPDNPADWEAVEPAHPETQADDNDVADNMEEYEKNTAILKELEISYNEVKEALKRIEEGEYGFCSVCSLPIETERLDANPGAKTCEAHMND